MREPQPFRRSPRGSRPFLGGPWPWLIAFGVAVALLVAYLAGRFPEVWARDGAKLSVVHAVGWLALIGGAVIVRWRARPGLALRHLGIWVLIFAVLLLGYSYRDVGRAAWERMRAELLPHAGRVEGEALVLTAGRGGHFVVEGEVDGIAVRFLVDTGATDVVLRLVDAVRIGLDPSGLAYTKRYRTANGTVMGAPVRLDRVRIGPITLRDVHASVTRSDMSSSLLGMSFLGRLSGYSVSGDKLTLRP